MSKDLKKYIKNNKTLKFHDLNEAIMNASKLLSVIDIEIKDIEDKELNPNNMVSYDKYFRKNFLLFQKLIEGSDINLNGRIELTDNLANIFSFFEAINKSSLKDYLKYKNNIMLDYINIIKVHYGTALIKYISSDRSLKK